jgi:hypothetical protein
MSKPCGLILATGAVTAEHITAALNDQGGPAWDQTVFRILAGLDIGSLVAGVPVQGEGTAISLASSGWWLRHLDDLAERLAKLAGVDVVALVGCPEPATSAWHLARTDGRTERQVIVGSSRSWVDGVGRLTGRNVELVQAPPLRRIAWMVHGEDQRGAHLPSVCNLRLDPGDPDEWEALVEVRGAALVDGFDWRPGPGRDPDEEPPTSMRSLMLAGPVRLPGPPRWARATRVVAVRTAEDAIRADGWVCLVPELEPGEAALYGTAVRILQLAPLGDGSFLGVLHPRCAVQVGEIQAGVASIELLTDQEPEDRTALADALDLLLVRLRARGFKIRYVPEELQRSDDPAAQLGWQVTVSPEHCQRYLAARGPIARIQALTDHLTRPRA